MPSLVLNEKIGLKCSSAILVLSYVISEELVQFSYSVVEVGFSANCILLTLSLQEFCEIVCVCM